MWGSRDAAEPPPLGTAARVSRHLSLPLSVLWVPLSAAATGGALSPLGFPPALRQRAGYPLCPNRSKASSFPTARRGSRLLIRESKPYRSRYGEAGQTTSSGVMSGKEATCLRAMPICLGLLVGVGAGERGRAHRGVCQARRLWILFWLSEARLGILLLKLKLTSPPQRGTLGDGRRVATVLGKEVGRNPAHTCND
jgi:hypothetical protein